MSELTFAIIVIVTACIGAGTLASIIISGWADDREVTHDNEEPNDN